MRTATNTDFQNQPGPYLEAVERGARLQVLRNGRRMVELSPVGPGISAPAWKRAGLRLRLEGTSLSEQILHERAETGQ